METEIGWTVTPGADGALHGGFTFNAWSGCTKYSPGCANCYAAALPPSMRRGAAWGPEAERVVAPDSYWRHPFAWARRAARLRVRLKVFAQSVSDWCEEREELHGPRMRLLALACLTRNDLDWLLLTKRAAHMRAVFDLPDLVEQVIAASAYFVEIGAVQNPLTAAEVEEGLARLYLGVSVENQKAADERAPELIAVRADVAAVRFLSCEPLLEAVDVRPYLVPMNAHMGHCRPGCVDDTVIWHDGAEVCRRCLRPVAGNFETPIHWVIIGGESGDRARPMRSDWARQLIAQCGTAGVPVFFKQWGEWAPMEWSGTIDDPSSEAYPHECRTADDDGGAWTRSWAWSADERSVRIGKREAGRHLDGRTFDGFPATGRA